MESYDVYSFRINLLFDMKSIIRISRTELELFFYSPIAWTVLILFTFQSSIVFIDLMERIMVNHQLGAPAINLTERLFSRLYPIPGIWRVTQNYLYLYVPLITMGLISRELQSGSMKLLQSSPMKVRNIVVGKYLGVMIFVGILLIILLLLFIAGSIWISNLDRGLSVSGLIGLYLLLGAYVAIGLFVSSLSDNQVIVAIGTLVLFTALDTIDKVGQRFDLIREIAYYLRLSSHVNHLLDGLIDTRDIFYYFIVMFCFVELTILRLRHSTSGRPLKIRIGRYVILFCGCLLTGYLTTRPRLTGYFDLTSNHTQTLSAVSRDIVQRIRTPLQVHDYVNILALQANLGYPEKRNEEQAVFDKYMRFLPNLTFDYTYYYDTTMDGRLFHVFYPGKTMRQIAIKQAHKEGFDFDHLLSPEAIRTRIDLWSEENRFVRQLNANGKTAFLRVYNFAPPKDQPMEAQITAALKRLVVNPPTICFLTGNHERNPNKPGDKNYRYATTQPEVKTSLINQGFDIVSINLDESELPLDYTVLVLADPTTSFTGTQLKKILRYIRAGGNMLIIGEVGHQAILNPLLDSLGVQMMKGELMEESRNHDPDLITTIFSDEAAKCSSAFGQLYRDSSIVTMPGAVGLQYEKNGPFLVTPLLVTNGKTTWNRECNTLSDTLRVQFNPAKGDARGSYPVALALTRTINGRAQRLLVFSDADFMSQKQIDGDYRIQSVNDVFLGDIFNWLTYGEFPPDTRHQDIHHQIRIDMGSLRLLRISFLGIFPLLLLTIALILLIRRRRR